MPLSAMEIFKLLPKTNCGECKFPTCMAFAMRLFAKSVQAEACPYLSDEAKAVLLAAAEPPIRKVTIGAGERRIEVGNETVLFRHDKTFYHPPGIAVRIPDTLEEEAIPGFVDGIAGYGVERIGERLGVDLVALAFEGGDGPGFARRARIAAEASPLPIIVMAGDPGVLSGALDGITGNRPLLYAAEEGNWEELAGLAGRHACPLAVRAETLDGLAELSRKVESKGVRDIIIDVPPRPLSRFLSWQNQIRRLALKRRFKPFGYPTMAVIEDGGGGEGPNGAARARDAVTLASTGVSKYAAVIVLPHFEKAEMLPILTLRQSIYSDPQKPIQMEPRVYRIGSPDARSPVFVTTNFSLTYFLVSGEIENAGISAHLILTDCEGMSVLTAWAAKKFVGDQVGSFVKGSGIEGEVEHREIVIPGLVARIQGDLEDALPGWTVVVGPEEAGDLPTFAQRRWNVTG